MSLNIKITEEDIFKFVFSPESLSKEKLEYLLENKERFEKEIILCKEFYTFKVEDIESMTQKVLEKSNRKVIELHPNIPKPIQKNGINLAAATELTEKPRSAFSFSDPDSKYLVRIIKTDIQNLLYLFTSEKKKDVYRLKFFPSETEYKITDLSQPIEILEEKTIEKILIE